MNRFIKTLPGKTVLFILCVITLLTAAASIFGALLMIENDFYTKSEKDIIKDTLRPITYRQTASIAEEYYFHHLEPDGTASKSTAALPKAQNIVFQISDESGEVIAESEGADTVQTWDFEHTHRFWVKNYVESPKNEYATLTVRIWLENSILENDLTNFYASLLSILYSLRHSIYAISVISFLIFIACFVALMHSAGRRSTDDELHPGALDAVPFDVLVLAAIITLCILFIPVVDIGRNLNTMYSSNAAILLIIFSLFAVISVSFAIGIAMSMASRIKQHKFIKSTAAYKLANFTFGIIASVFRALKNIVSIWFNSFAESAVMPKTLIITAIITFIEFFAIASNIHQGGNIFTFWFFEKLLIIPLILLTVTSMRKLEKSAKALAEGDLSHKTDTSRMWLNLKTHGENLNNIAKGMSIAVEDRLKSERMKTELITNVSHDIKTPLTSIINYSGLIIKELNTGSAENEPSDEGTSPDMAAIMEYTYVLSRQSAKLKNLIDDLVEASKASTGNIDIALAPADASLYLEQLLGEYSDRLEQAGLAAVVNSSIKEGETFIMADARRMWRIFDNIMNNICKYSLSGTRVYLDLETKENSAVFTFKNTSKEALNMSEDELFERFTRGDASRNTEGNGLGLSIAKSLAALQGGTLKISIDGDLFKVILTFPSI